MTQKPNHDSPEFQEAFKNIEQMRGLAFGKLSECISSTISEMEKSGDVDGTKKGAYSAMSAIACALAENLAIIINVAEEEFGMETAHTIQMVTLELILEKSTGANCGKAKQ